MKYFIQYNKTGEYTMRQNDKVNQEEAANLETLSKEELISRIKDLEDQAKSKQSGRKAQVLKVLQSHQSISILDISRELKISTKNVSSQLTYLRSDGFEIFTDNNGKKFLMENLAKTEEIDDDENSEETE